MKLKLFVITFLLVLVCNLFPASCAFAEVPRLVNYQGRLTDSNGAPLNGSYALTFRIYDAETAGNLLWEEMQNGVVVNKGIFSVLLGSVTNLNIAFDRPYFLEIKVGNEVMTPRQRIASAAYAMTAENGVPKGVVVMWSGAAANIPAGWALCDGANGTPDLRNRFVVGAGSSYSVAATGGEATHVLTIAEMPAHTHNIQLTSGEGGSRVSRYRSDNHDDNFPTDSTGGGQAHNNLPPYYALCYIMKK